MVSVLRLRLRILLMVTTLRPVLPLKGLYLYRLLLLTVPVRQFSSLEISTQMGMSGIMSQAMFTMVSFLSIHSYLIFVGEFW